MSRRNKRNKHEEHENHERWLVSYADFITLLFAFFVVMYALSSINEGKYKVASESIKNALSNKNSLQPQTKLFIKKDSFFNNITIIANKHNLLLKNNQNHYELEISGDILFSPGNALLSNESKKILIIIANELKNISNDIEIQGHTDNTPINNSVFSSNWELSTARALTVSKLFIAEDISSNRLKLSAYADNKSLYSNDTVEGRSKNRRITILIFKNEKAV